MYYKEKGELYDVRSRLISGRMVVWETTRGREVMERRWIFV